eukprot:scaffold4811_cov16-Tisochrysis_lutea.AAC.1
MHRVGWHRASPLPGWGTAVQACALHKPGARKKAWFLWPFDTYQDQDAVENAAATARTVGFNMRQVTDELLFVD